jgi:replicative DNA helicase
MVVEYEAYLRNLKNNRFITGIDEIDRRIRGVAGGEVLTILARAGSFKTAMLQNLLTRYVKNSTWGAVMFSIEMPVASVTERWFQILDGCTGKEVERQFTDKINTDLKSASVEQFNKDLSRLYVIPSKVGLEDLVQYVRLIEAEHGVRIGVVGVDYMGLMDAPGENEYQQVSGVAKGIKGIAKRLNIPVLMLSQVSRKGGDGEVEISLDMGRGSGAVEEAADFVLGLWQAERPQVMCTTDERTEYDLVCRILKNRKGPKGSRWKLDIDAQTLRFGTSAVEYVVQKTSRKKKCG